MSGIRRRLTVASVVLLLLWLGVGWYYSSQALVPGGARAPEFDLVVVDVDDAAVVLPASADARLTAVGLLPESGDWYAQMLGEAVPVKCEVHGDCVRRDYVVVEGGGPEVGDLVKADEYFFPPGRPDLAVGADVVQDLRVDLDVGAAPAWWIPPVGSDLVVVGVHGRGGAREEMLRLAQIVVSQGHGMLIPTYRGDGVAPDPADGLGRFGTAEWVDVAMAMLADEVPEDVRFVLAGASQGGGLAAALLAQADVADRVDGVILDSPLIGLDATMLLQARLAGIPGVLTRPVLEGAYLVSRLRGFNFAAGEHVDFLAGSTVPLLLFHGPGDEFVPGDPSETLAQLRPDVVYERTPGVDHVRFWNNDPGAYTAAVLDFLEKVAQ